MCNTKPPTGEWHNHNVPTTHGASLGREQERGAHPRRPADGPRALDAQGGNPTPEATRGVSPRV